MSNIFTLQQFPQDCNYPNGLMISFFSIIKPEQFFCWYQSVLVSELFGSKDVVSENNRIFILRYNQVGGIRFKQSRVTPNSCQALNYNTGTIDKSQKCYAEYSSSSKETSYYGPYLNSTYNCSTNNECSYQTAFRFSQNISDSITIKGQISSYGPTGFYIDTESILDDNDTLTQTALSNLGTYLQNNL